MRVRDVMTTTIWSCPENASLASVANTMFDHNCGFVPIVSGSGQVVGVLTDRDICMALVRQDARPSEVGAAALAHGHVVTCHSGDEIDVALQIMENSKVRRLPVVDETGKLKGIVSLTDVLRHAIPVCKHDESVTCAHAVGALKVINRPSHPRKPWVIAAE